MMKGADRRDRECNMKLERESGSRKTGWLARRLSRALEGVRGGAPDPFGRASGAKAILDDLGMTRFEIGQYARGAEEARLLLPAMAARLGIALDQLSWATRYELQQSCALCTAHSRCRAWLARSDGDDRADRRFCWNGRVFAGLLNESRRRGAKAVETAGS